MRFKDIFVKIRPRLRVDDILTFSITTAPGFTIISWQTQHPIIHYSLKQCFVLFSELAILRCIAWTSTPRTTPTPIKILAGEFCELKSAHLKVPILKNTNLRHPSRASLEYIIVCRCRSMSLNFSIS